MPPPATPIVADKDPAAIQEPTQALQSEPKKKRRKSAPKDGIDNTGVPGKVQFPAEMPVNITKLLRQYFVARSSNIVPIDIYYMQVPWVYKLHDAPNKKDATDADYFLAATGEPVHVRPFSLPWMHNQPGGKNSQRLLVAENSSLGKEPVVLTRTKKNSREFRIWRGVDDDPFEQAVVVKKPLEATRGEHRGDSSRAGRQPSLDGDATNGSVVDDTHYRNLRRRRGQESAPASPAECGSTVLPSKSHHPRLLGLKRKRGADDVEGDSGGDLKDNEESDDDEQDAPAPTPVRAISSPIIDLSKQVFLCFDGPNQRHRSLFSCGNFAAFFTNAIAAGIIRSDDRFPVLKCVLTGCHGGPTNRVIADEQDFADMVRAIMSDGGWNNEDAQCAVCVSK